jgi:hypothetical protein
VRLESVEPAADRLGFVEQLRYGGAVVLLRQDLNADVAGTLNADNRVAGDLDLVVGSEALRKPWRGQHPPPALRDSLNRDLFKSRRARLDTHADNFEPIWIDALPAQSRALEHVLNDAASGP